MGREKEILELDFGFHGNWKIRLQQVVPRKRIPRKKLMQPSSRKMETLESWAFFEHEVQSNTPKVSKGKENHGGGVFPIT